MGGRYAGKGQGSFGHIVHRQSFTYRNTGHPKGRALYKISLLIFKEERNEKVVTESEEE